MTLLRILMVLTLIGILPVAESAAAGKNEVVGARWRVTVYENGMEAAKHVIRLTRDYKIMFQDTQLGTYTQGRANAVLKISKGSLKGVIKLTKVERTWWSGTWTQSDGTKRKVQFRLLKD